MHVLNCARARVTLRVNCQQLRRTFPTQPAPAVPYRPTMTSPYSSAAEATPGSAKADFSSIIYSENQPADLPNRVRNLSAWEVTPSKMGLTRQFTFPTFNKAWQFMSVVADECKAKRHHPSWHNLYNQVTVEWTTHRPKGLSIKDVEMAEFCDKTAQEIGLKNTAPSSATGASATS